MPKIRWHVEKLTGDGIVAWAYDPLDFPRGWLAIDAINKHVRASENLTLAELAHGLRAFGLPETLRFQNEDWSFEHAGHYEAMANRAGSGNRTRYQCRNGADVVQYASAEA